MACVNRLDTYNNATQAIEANGVVLFGKNDVQCGCGIQHVAGSSAINVKQGGKYYVSTEITYAPTAAGTVTAQLYNGTNVVAGASDTETIAANGTTTFTITKIINVNPSCACINNNADLSVQISAAGSVTSCNFAIWRL